jgi:NH3-dependent NAD+ synthetase
MTQGKALEYCQAMALAVLGTDNNAEVYLGFHPNDRQ